MGKDRRPPEGEGLGMRRRYSPTGRRSLTPAEYSALPLTCHYGPSDLYPGNPTHRSDPATEQK